MRKVLGVLFILAGLTNCTTSSAKKVNYECAGDGATCVAPLTQPSQIAYDPNRPCTSGDEICLNAKREFYISTCNSGNDVSGCYNYGLLREQDLPEDDVDFNIAGQRGDISQVLQIYQMSCDGGERKACDAIRSLLQKQCSNARILTDKDCYEPITVQKNEGVSRRTLVRIHNNTCDDKIKETAEIACTMVGDFEAKKGNYPKAEEIYTATCDSPLNRSGCGGLVCVGYSKMNEGKQAEAKRLFKKACDFSEVSPGVHDGAAYSGCFAIPTPPKYGTINKQAFAKVIREAIKDMPNKEAECKNGWSHAWGPSRPIVERK